MKRTKQEIDHQLEQYFKAIGGIQHIKDEGLRLKIQKLFDYLKTNDSKLALQHAEELHLYYKAQIDDSTARINNLKSLEQAIQNNSEEAFEDLIRNVLDNFVTHEGTKRPISYTREEEAIVLDASVSKNLHALPPNLLNIIFKNLDERRILRDNEDSFELAHDTLAAIIDESRTGEQRLINRLQMQVKNAFEAKANFQEEQLGVIESYLNQLELSTEERAFLKENRAQLESELEQSRQQIRRQRILLIFSAVLTILVLISGFYTLQFQQASLEQQRKLLLSIYDQQMLQAVTSKEAGDYDAALENLPDSVELKFGLQASEQNRIDSIRQNWLDLKNIVSHADSLHVLWENTIKNETASVETDSFVVQSLVLYEEAYAQEKDAFLQPKVTDTKEDIHREMMDIKNTLERFIDLIKDPNDYKHIEKYLRRGLLLSKYNSNPSDRTFFEKNLDKVPK